MLAFVFALTAALLSYGQFPRSGTAIGALAVFAMCFLASVRGRPAKMLEAGLSNRKHRALFAFAVVALVAPVAAQYQSLIVAFAVGLAVGRWLFAVALGPGRQPT